MLVAFFPQLSDLCSQRCLHQRTSSIDLLVVQQQHQLALLLRPARSIALLELVASQQLTVHSAHHQPSGFQRPIQDPRLRPATLLS